MTALQEHVLSAPDVCNSCFRLVREERSQTETTDKEPVSTSLSAYTRVRQTTSVEHVRSDWASESVAVFCECGLETVYERLWDDGEDRCLATYRFKDLLRRCIYSLEEKGVTLDRETCVKTALHLYKTDGHDANDALESAVEASIQRAIAADGRSKTAPLSD